MSDCMTLSQAKVRGDTVDIDLWYPTVDGNPDKIQIGLMDVRAADDIRVSYDHSRDGWKIEQQKDPESEADDNPWVEVAFIEAWGLSPEARDLSPEAEVEGGSGKTMPVVRLKFKGQATINDRIVDVDPEGPDEWEVDRRWFLERFPTEEEFNNDHWRRDELRCAHAAPEWVRAWGAPFEVELTCHPDDIWV